MNQLFKNFSFGSYLLGQFVTIIIMISGLVITYFSSIAPNEYAIELLNQTTVKIHSIKNDTTYYCHPDSITVTIDQDNL